ncbi:MULTISPECIES: envelope stress response membrane protein PspB [Idiomarina]|jgi:phage shock protein B|uniref:Envelope stress response membrane protein PspB n=2 Tax=Idiomarina baltica TaxID=190892 RepID=A0A348WQE9_9GAMM|nr:MULTISPECIES: envelope stress response membrane protein PspB [Idiomarina]MAD54395.1 envelope stress response membrane protein PspB [Idiomarinaceae bacterium]MEC7642059.1 envelope stress response membrane protein PspB [Pseudomonadota bacterium]EAQ32039.1 Phage shock protein B [Idiomarina baltica OS145]KXS35749.1 MAG: phage shock protein B [Idiomarina sp. T82-3]MAF75107.1 envelope stress response membrane protein PspB [Idiomarinaceae bacterium]|tara:strand:+ start:269 stop:502 length:234 start_codon:yes stop_codon:yes gene_type:complete
MDFLEFLMAPIIIFLVIVAPIWLILHYKSKRNASQGISEEERSQLNQMSERVEKMRERVQTLERILDADSPSWREHK